MFAALLAAAALSATPVTIPVESPAQTSTVPAEDAVRLEDLTVTGRSLDRLINTFIYEVAAPNPGRNLARWRNRVCVGAFNMLSEGGQYLVDRVSTVAQDVGLSPGAPGCEPNVVIIASPNPEQLAQALVERQKRAFRGGGSGMDRGGSALRAFQSTDKPVRWWQVSMPIDSATMNRATRIPGDMKGNGKSPMDAAPHVAVFAASRLTTQIVNDIYKTIIILDAEDIERVSSQQLADYIAMVTLAQINPDADTSHYVSILNVFDDPHAAQGLTEWDKAYLKGLYDAQRTQRNLASSRLEIGASIQRAHRDLTRAQD